MTRALQIAAALGRRRSTRVGAAALGVCGLAAGSLPLLQAPGYELGEAGALLAALLAAPAGIAAWRLERDLPAPSPAAAWGGASLAVCAQVAALFAGALVRAALGPCTAVGRAAGFLPLLAAPSALLGAALAVLAATVAGGRRALAALLYAGAAAASLAVSLRAAYLGPAAFAFDPLLGAFPGPIYDEALEPDLRTLLVRTGALLLAAGVTALAATLVRWRGRGPRAAAAPLAALAVAAAGWLGIRATLSALGLSGEREVVQRELGGRRDGRRCTVVYPSEETPARAAALLAECEFQAADVARLLGVADPPHVTAYFHRSAAEKRRLVGASGTDFTKPWLGELHVIDGPLPHPTLRHEIVHAIAAAAATGPLRVPARGLVFVSSGLVEGVAVALETPRSRWSVHEWSRAARALKLLPDVRRIVGSASFWAEPPARAYTAAGSFLRFVLDRHGAAAVREAYRTGDLARATGEPLDALVTAWERFLDGVPLPPALAAAAEERLARGSIFARTCAREVASLEARAGRASGAGRTAEACALLREAAARSGSPRDLKAAGDALLRAGELDAAGAAYAEVDRAAPPQDVALRAALAAARADLAWLRGGPARAAAGWTAALVAGPERGEERLLQAKLVAAGDPVLGPAARDLLLGRGDPTVALARVARVDRPLSAYLLGRALAGRGEAAAAVPELARAAAGGLPSALADEAALLLGAARCASGDPRGGEAGLEALLARAATDADRERVGEALRRCAVEVAQAGSAR